MSGPTLAPPSPSRSVGEPRPGARRLRRRRRRLHTIALGGLVGMLAAALLAVNGWLWLERRDTVDELHATRADVDHANRQLERAITNLALLTDEVARAKQASGIAQLELGRIRGTLASARETLAAQGIQVDALTSCLDGVTAAVDQHGIGNDAAAIDTLRNVGGACNRALVSIGGSGPVYALDFADPFVLTTNEGYYGYATNSGGGDVQVIRSADLRKWQVVGEGLAGFPDWAEEHLTWAPTVLARGSTFVLYYTVREASTDRQCISRAVANEPRGPFVDDSEAPLRCADHGDIDASPFVDRSGRAYLLWRSSDPIRITAQPLSADGLGLVGDARDLVGADQDWENGTVEGPAMVRIGDRYHLFYSGNEWSSSDYAIGHAVCRSPFGPCRKTGEGGLVLASSGTIAGPGGQEVFLDSAGGIRLAYHAYTEPYVGYPASRRLHLATVSFDGPRAVITPG